MGGVDLIQEEDSGLRMRYLGEWRELGCIFGVGTRGEGEW